MSIKYSHFLTYSVQDRKEHVCRPTKTVKVFIVNTTAASDENFSGVMLRIKCLTKPHYYALLFFFLHRKDSLLSLIYVLTHLFIISVSLILCIPVAKLKFWDAKHT